MSSYLDALGNPAVLKRGKAVAASLNTRLAVYGGAAFVVAVLNFVG